MQMGKGTDIQDFDRHETIKPGSDRNFGLVFAAFFSCWQYCPSGRRPPLAVVDTAAVMLAIAMIRPALLVPLNVLGTKFGLLLFRFVSPVAGYRACVSWKRHSPTFPQLLRRTRTTLP
jgi:hypothetical protein